MSFKDGFHGCRECGCEHTEEWHEEIVERVEKLEKAIESAPHGKDCPARFPADVRLDYVERDGGYTCDCWKRAVLEEK